MIIIMNKIFNIIDKPSRDGMPRNGFSMDHSRQFALNAGELHCPTNFELVPGDSINLEASAFFRAMTMNSAAFANCKVLVDWYFVPYVQLWSLFDNFLTQRDTDRFSSALKSSLYQPYIPLRQLIGSIFATKYNTLISSSFSDFFLFRSADRALQLIDELGYGNWFPMYDWWKEQYDLKEAGEDYDDDIDDWDFVPDKDVNLWPILAYQKIYNSYYRDSEIDTPLPTENFNVDHLDCSTHEKASYLYGVNDGDTLRHILFDNVGGNRGLLNMRYRKWTRDIFTSTQPSTQFGAVSTVPVNPQLFNDIPFNLDSDAARWSKKSSTPVTAQGDDVKWSQNQYNLMVENSGGETVGLQHYHRFFANALNNRISDVPTFSVLIQKYAEAMQEWRQNALRAGNHMKDNMKAHYGVEPYYHNDTEPVHLQSWEFTMQPTDVTATANTGDGGNNELGSTTGKLVGGSEFNRPVSFNARDFGVCMCIVTIVPQSGYDSYMLDKKLTKGSSPFDYWTPEFDSVGLQPITASELNFCARKGSLKGCNVSLGYHARYSEYKYMVSKSFHLFEHNHTGADGAVNGAFSSYVTNRFDMQRIDFEDSGDSPVQPLFSRFFRYVNPSVLSSIFVQETPSIDSPQFICTFGFYGTKVSNMSLLGMPRF